MHHDGRAHDTAAPQTCGKSSKTTFTSINFGVPTFPLYGCASNTHTNMLRLGVTLKSVTLGNVTMSHRTREARRMPCVSLPLNYDRSRAQH
ncbi:hypothetical protein EVAR_27636_1 [Eumeta japonica]|uniref:Uncharacterized protein n=1 Tax=Eumeta variegata TaxID=151549 RepID=A0A4C1V1Q0_EUMVA|nr:hypothetical protein EVAR_27636_1 [Eumeta japonica]